MSKQPAVGRTPPLRVGAVAYLNAQPLFHCLSRIAPDVEISVDLPSRLADSLALGRLDVAIVPSIEYLRQPRHSVVSDACIACDGPVRSVKLYSRVPIERIRTLALDEGSRTSVALTKILLRERFALTPRSLPLAIGAALEDSTTDAVVLIGDRGMRPVPGEFACVWDLGEEWSRWTGLPFVFALWVARPGVDAQRVGEVLTAARDEGVRCFEEIASAAAPAVGIAESECLAYLRDHLEFHLGPRQRQGLALFYELAARHGLAGRP